MARTITIPDETYERLERLAKETDQTPVQALAAMLEGQVLRSIEVGVKHNGQVLTWRITMKQDSNEEPIFQLLRGMGLDDDEIARLQAAPPERRATEIEVILNDLLDEAVGRDPLTAPRHLTFDQFFRALGDTDEEIEEARRQAAADANL